MSDRVSRREFVTTATAAAIAATTVHTTGASMAEDVKQEGRLPNILWICPDQQRWDTINALGNQHIRTPNIDKLCSSGVAFTHAHCQTPICTPSRASFLTGMYPDAIRACINGNDYWADAAPLVTQTLADIGYDCGLSGKLHLSAANGRIEIRPENDGYRVFHWSHHPHPSWPEGHDYDDWLKSNGQDYSGLYRKHDKSIPKEWHQTRWCADRAIDFIKEERSGPWLFSLNCFDPHGPFDPPKEYIRRFDVDLLPGPLLRESDYEAQESFDFTKYRTKERSEREAKETQARYWAQIELIDENVGRILKALDESGQRENTIIIYTSDHGDMVGDHGLWAKGCRFYEGLVRVPLIISWPARFEQGLQSDALVELTDIVPTLLEIAGLDIPGGMQGRSLLPILEGKADSGEHRDFVRSIYFLALPRQQVRASMIRTRDFKFVKYHDHDVGELYDMKNDPGEFENLWDDPEYTKVRLELSEKALDSMAMAADAGLVPCGDVICVAGTGRGADTCAVVGANTSNRFFKIKVREIIAKPVDF